MTSEAKPCPFYGIPCEYVPMAEKADAQAARIEQLEAALRPLACTCKAKHQAECSRSEVDCPFWNARAALGEERT